MSGLVVRSSGRRLLTTEPASVSRLLSGGRVVTDATVYRLRDLREIRRRASCLSGTSPPPTARKRKRRRRQLKKQVKKQKTREIKVTTPKSKSKKMASSRIYKLDDGNPYLSNYFPAKNLLRIPEEGRGHWLVCRKSNLKKKSKSVNEAPDEEGQEVKQKSPSEVRGNRRSQRENQVTNPGQILDRAFLLKHHRMKKPSDLCHVNVSGLKLSTAKEKDFKHFRSVIYINASENLLPLEAFHTFPALKELELALNGIKTIYMKYGDFKCLEFLDLSFNSLTGEAICVLGILPHLRVLLLTGNGLTSLPSNLAVTEQETSVMTLTSKKYTLRFPALETLMLDDNKLSSPNCFASLAGLRRLKKLSLDQNRIFRIPYLQQVHLRDGSGDWVGGEGRPQKEHQSMLRPKLWVYEDSDEQPDYTVLPMRKDVDRTEVVFSSRPGFSTSQTAKICALPPIFEILPVKSLKAGNKTLAPPFPELRYLSLAYNKISKEDSLLAVALFPSLCELVFHNNPLVARTRGVPPLLKSFLQERLGIHLIRRKIVKAKHPHILMPRKDSRKVKTQIPKVPKQPLMSQYPAITVASPSLDVLEPEAESPEELPTARRTSMESEGSIEGLEGLSTPHRKFVPLPPIYSTSTVHSEETMSHPSDAAGPLSPECPSDEDAKSIESIFLTQVSELPTSNQDELKVKEQNQKRPSTAPGEVKKTQKKLHSASLPQKYHGYEELLTTKPDPDFFEPKGIQKNVQALQHMLRHPLQYRSSKPRVDTWQKPFVSKVKRIQRVPIPPSRKTRAQLLDDILIRMRDPQNVTEAPLGAVLRRRVEQRLVTHKQYVEAKRLLKELRARYRELVRSSVQGVFGSARSTPPRQALGQAQPKFGSFLEFMDEFCQETPANE